VRTGSLPHIHAATPDATAAPNAGSAAITDHFTTKQPRTSARPRFRLVVWLFLLIAVSFALIGAIGSPRLIFQAGSARAGKHDSDGIVSSVVPGPTPTPLQCPTCCPCWFPATISQNFDQVVPPGLPQGWLATNALGPPPLWVTSNSGVPMPPADSLPNAAYIDDPAVVSDKRLETFPFAASLPRLIFRHSFNLDASSSDPNLGFDGGVLEFSFDGGNTFQDIVQVGGVFLQGGYNRTISSDRGSPIAGRQAWSGNSGGFITTVVNIPQSFINGVLRWRMASDNSGSAEGWRVDTVNISWCINEGCPHPTPKQKPTPRPRPCPAPRPTP
jgi:hypothetical protein